MKSVVAMLLALLLCSAGFGALADQRADMLVAVAVSELGYSATKGGYTKYGEWGGKAYGEWCSEFVSWCVNRADEVYGAGMLGSEYPMQTSCDEGAAWFRERGRYVSVSGTVKGAGEQFYLTDGVSVAERPYVPQAGDLIYIEWYKYNRLDHVGIVEYVTQEADGTYIVHTIEGNNRILGPEPTVVARYSYRLDDPSIRGYGIQREELIGTELATGSSGEAVIEYQRALRDLGYYDGDCAGKYGKATAEATKALQKACDLPQTGDADRITRQEMAAMMQERRTQAAQRAQEQADALAGAMLESAKDAIANSWFGEFDPYDEETAWARLMADITVLDVKQNEKVHLSNSPNGSRKTSDPNRGYFYGESVAVNVLDEQDGWVQIEAYNSYDELEQGWVRKSRLKTVTPNSEYGLIVDKMAQRLYIYQDGRLLTELLVSTGATTGGNAGYNETASGEFLLCSAVGGFWAGTLWCNYAIRFNGGDLLHLVPSVMLADGTEDFSLCESALGSRASHGCIRVQRKENEDGYNHLWIWNNLRNVSRIKIIVWDDDGRKQPVTQDSEKMYYNPDGGAKYHTTARCSSVRKAYLPLTGITYGDLSRYPYSELVPCGVCGAPARPESVKAWNDAIDQAYAELGLPAEG